MHHVRSLRKMERLRSAKAKIVNICAISVYIQVKNCGVNAPNQSARRAAESRVDRSDPASASGAPKCIDSSICDSVDPAVGSSAPKPKPVENMTRQHAAVVARRKSVNGAPTSTSRLAPSQLMGRRRGGDYRCICPRARRCSLTRYPSQRTLTLKMRMPAATPKRTPNIGSSHVITPTILRNRPSRGAMNSLPNSFRLR
jgi:hypothetical protein